MYNSAADYVRNNLPSNDIESIINDAANIFAKSYSDYVKIFTYLKSIF